MAPYARVRLVMNTSQESEDRVGSVDAAAEAEAGVQGEGETRGRGRGKLLASATCSLEIVEITQLGHETTFCRGCCYPIKPAALLSRSPQESQEPPIGGGKTQKGTFRRWEIN